MGDSAGDAMVKCGHPEGVAIVRISQTIATPTNDPVYQPGDRFATEGPVILVYTAPTIQTTKTVSQQT